MSKIGKGCMSVWPSISPWPNWNSLFKMCYFLASMEAISAEDNFYLSASFQAKWFCIKLRHCCLLLNGFLIPLLANEWAYAQLTLSIQQMWNKKLFKNQWNKIAQKLQEITRPKAPKLFFIWNQKSILALLNGYISSSLFDFNKKLEWCTNLFSSIEFLMYLQYELNFRRWMVFLCMHFLWWRSKAILF